MSKGRLLSYYNDAPIADATINLYYTNGIPFQTDKVVTTDSDGYFSYKKLKDTIVTAIPSKTGWWCLFEYGYALNNKSDAFENDSIIYMFHQATAQVTCMFKTLLTPPSPG
jgi:hypothetical protein